MRYGGRIGTGYSRTSAEKLSMSSKGKGLGIPVASGPRTWVQTDRANHEAWGRLTLKSSKAAGLLHHLVANMGHQNAVVASQKTLSKIMGCSLDTVQRALALLEEHDWIQVVRVNGPGSVAAYVVNDRVAWGEAREHMTTLSVFSATVVTDREDQTKAALSRHDLRRIPVLYTGERQLPTGPGLPPPSQPSLEGLEPDLPAHQMDVEDFTE